MSKYSEAQKRSSMKYEQANIERVVIKLNRNTDQDLIKRRDHLKSLKSSVQAEIMQAWREFIDKE